MRQFVLVALIVGFGVFTAEALFAHGLVGFFATELSTLAGIQVLLDLVIACSLILIWMYHDARARGATFWPFALLTLTLGSFGPLTYLLVRERAKARDAAPSALAHASRV